MSVSSVRGGRLGAAAVLVLTAGSLAVAAGPAGAAPSAPSTVADCDPAGNIMLNPTTVVSGGSVNVSWHVVNIAGCNPAIISERISGPGFNGDEAVTTSGSRTVTLSQPGPSTATWTLSVATRFGETALDEQSATVEPAFTVNGLAGAAIAFPDASGTETKMQIHSEARSTGAPVKSGTRVALFNVGGDYEAAYQGANGDLWVVAPDGTATDTGLGMAAGTSPSITATGASSFTVAFQANTGALWTYSSATGGRSVGFGMAQGTSPSVTLTSAGIAIAYVDPNGNLAVIDPVTGFGGYGTPHAPVAPGTSPAITYIPNQKDAYEIVYQAPDHSVRTADYAHAQTFPTLLTAAAGTSPAITTLPSGEIDIAVNGSDGTVQTLTSAGTATTIGFAFPAGTSPAIAPAAGGGAVVAWEDVNNTINTFVTGVGVTRTGVNTFPGSSPAIAQITSLTR
ncbi:hypothetical protein [Streptomyces cellostaticus]|uniref:hypothetical protein n=1 Tax=Streptomyces cellostaticus TaxID=67285 RepID=UPI000AF1EBC0|nr:hypothetical protein [Streptomyces cellostaticus]GHI10074.1 hypothetical protein Scel_83950 [Streptomyces cellostaticus]